MEYELIPWAAISVVAVVTFCNRIAGPIIMSRIEMSAKIERFLDAMSVSVVAALVASILAQGGLREATAVAVSSLVMLRAGGTIWAIVVGICTAAAWSLFL